MPLFCTPRARWTSRETHPGFIYLAYVFGMACIRAAPAIQNSPDVLDLP
jgi:hypothetical protein